MTPFLRRHTAPVALVVFGMVALFVINWLAQSAQIGINPYEFMLKACGKFFYAGLAWIVTHIIVKYFFSTIYEYTCRGDKAMSEFTRDWRFKSENEEDTQTDARLAIAVYTHIGIFIAVCLLFALAF